MKRIGYIFIFLLFLIIIDDIFCQDFIISPDQNNNEIKISGNIALKQFYGSPNYGEEPEIDKIEAYYVLMLYESISFFNGIETVMVEEIQLILDINNFSGDINSNWEYTIIGKAFFLETGHHHTPIIILVDAIILTEFIKIF